MKLSFAKVFALTFLITTCSFLNGEVDEEPTLFIDSISLQMMTDLTIPGIDDPITVARENVYSLELPGKEIVPSFSKPALSEDTEETVLTIYHFLLTDPPSDEYTLTAINRLQFQIANLLSEAGYYGIAVTVDPNQIDMLTGDDFRYEDDTSLNLQIWIGEVVTQRTVAKGERIKEGSLINHPSHEKVIKNSPFAPGTKLNESGTFLIDKPELDSYLERLNQSPNRRVDVAVSSAGKPGEVVLDYVVNEPKPWVGYLQVSNTGTESTGEWRQRVGVVHYQLTGHDDVLAVDFFTAEFDTANALVASYDFPVLQPDFLILKTYASYSDFASQNLIIATSPDALGRTITYGAESIYTPFYVLDHSASATVGLKYEDVTVEDVIPDNDGFARFLSPYLRLELRKRKKEHRSYASVILETNVKDNSQPEFDNFGRQDITEDYTMLNFRIFQSFFIEPLLPGYGKNKEENWLANSLVHEFAVSFRGQFLTDNARLIPQKQYYAGGLFSVRGYNESAARGDTGTIGSVEYRLHLARLLKPYSLLEERGGRDQVSNVNVRDRFNFRAPSPFGLPDWNLIFRGFVDWASLSINDPLTTEIEQDLLSYGLGFEFQYSSSLNFRLDFGVVANELETSNTAQPIEEDGDKGDSRFHLLVTYSF